MIKKIPPDTEAYKFYNANPKNKQTTDCVIRAISVATGRAWDDVLDELVQIAHKYKEAPDSPKCYGKYLESLGFDKRPQPKHEDNTKYTGLEFCRSCSTYYTHGEILVANLGPGHVVAIAPTHEGDGINDRYKVWDTWDSTLYTIGNYWIRRTK